MLFVIRLPFKTIRLLGFRRLFWIGIGAAIGVAVAPGPGIETRERVRRWVDAQMEARQGFEVATGPEPEVLDLDTVG